jgi:hypothetical protein
MTDQYDKLGNTFFCVTSIEKTEPPAGVTEGEWYQYTIGHGESAIHGRRSGSLQSVTRHAEEYAENLNQRKLLGHSAYAALRLQK